MSLTQASRILGVFVALLLAPDTLAAPICSGGTVIKNSGGTIVGCKFTTWTSSEISQCSGATILSTTRNGFCYVCLVEPYAAQVQSGNWSGLTPNDFTCLGCVNSPGGNVGWWSFDENFGTSFDLSPGSPNYNDRFADFYNGGTFLPGKVQGEAQLDGVNDYVEVLDHPDLNFGAAGPNGAGNFSFEGWIRLSSLVNYQTTMSLVDKRLSSPVRGYHIALYYQKLLLQLADGTSYNFVAPTVVPANDTWYHVAITVDRLSTTGVAFYLNGALQGTANPTARSGSLATIHALRFGTRSPNLGGGAYFNGRIDELSLYNRVLTQSEIQAIFNADRYGKCKPYAKWW